MVRFYSVFCLTALIQALYYVRGISLTNRTCEHPTGFSCADGKCLNQAYVCDGVEDCESDESTCSPQSKPRLLSTDGYTIYMRYLSGGKTHVLYRYPKDRCFGRVIALDYFLDSTKNETLIFWSKGDFINYGRLDEQSQKIVFINSWDTDKLKKSPPVESLALDWVGQNIYWINFKEKAIKVADFHGNYTKTLLKTQDTHMRGLAIDPAAGYIFWLDWTEALPKLSRASTNGMDKKDILFLKSVNGNASWPNGIFLDRLHKHVFWIDARSDSIHRTDYQGENHKVIWKMANASHPFSLVWHRDMAFWSDWRKNRIEAYNSNLSFPFGKYNLYDLALLHRSTQPEYSVSPCSDKECSQICLIGYNFTAECACEDEPIMDGGNSSCIKTSTDEATAEALSIHNSTTEAISKSTTETPFRSTTETLSNSTNMTITNSTTCSDDQYHCTSGECIQMHALCDNQNDCADRSDENLICENSSISCGANLFRCDGNACIPSDWRCDGIKECRDGSDEKDCSAAPCRFEREFKCNDFHCINETWRCDGDKDCPDGADELGCAENTCNETEFTCGAGTCVPINWICDGKNDCKDGSDEKNCTRAGQYCHKDQYKCHSTSQCILSTMLCNGQEDCVDGSDEIYCTEPCSPEQFACGNGTCIPRSWLCDRVPDCIYGRDEQQNCSAKCHSDQFQCFSGNCIPRSFRCNGRNDCNDGSDEEVNCSVKLAYSTESSLHLLIDENGDATELEQSKHAIAVAVNPIDRSVYFSMGIKDGRILQSLGTNSTPKIIVDEGISSVEGLAVDWVGDNIYWVDSVRKVIEVAKLDGKHRLTLIKDVLDRPRSLALDVKKGLMFWTDWDTEKPRIGRASMTGFGQTITLLVKKLDSSGGYPNGLALDAAKNMIYWSDAKSHSINRANYEGRNFRRLVKDEKSIIRPFDLVLIGGDVYFTHWSGISKVDPSGNLKEVIKSPGDNFIGMDTLNSEHFVDSAIAGKCHVNGWNCTQLCLYGEFGQHVCRCQNGYDLSTTNGSCIVSPSCNSAITSLC